MPDSARASDKCLREKRKTINGDDMLWAMMTLGFENYVGPMKQYLNKFRELEVGHRRGCGLVHSCAGAEGREGRSRPPGLQEN